MKRLLSCFLGGGVLLLTATSILAKAPTVRITITGGKLSRPVQITNGEILAASNAWDTAFLNVSKSPLTEVPNVTSTYEVTFYSQIADNDIRKTCILYYLPRSSAEQGFIYLPGKGTLGELNAGTVIRQGRDGRWNYASPAWELLIKRSIANAETERNSMPVSRTNTATARQQSLNPSRLLESIVDGWSKPQSGWLYILDPRSDPNAVGSRVWLLDPKTSKVMGSIRAGYDPDFALSPDGSRLYIASGERESGELAVIDTATGNLRHIRFADRILYKPWYKGLPPFSGMTIASGGAALWIAGQHVLAPDRVELRLSSFDTQRETLLSTTLDLGKCAYGNFVFSAANSAAKQLGFLCEGLSTDLNRIQFLRLTAQQPQNSGMFEFPWPPRCGVAEAFFSSGGKTMALVRSDGAIYEMNTVTQKFSRSTVNADCSESPVANHEWPLSADGAKLYLGYGGVASDGMSAGTELRVLDAATWNQLGRVQTSVPFWSVAVSQDGKQIYAVAPKHHRVLIIDAVTLQEQRAISIGNTPSLAIVALVCAEITASRTELRPSLPVAL